MRFVCIHGHFYQPPRENPWLEAVEWQDSAYPYHDWNERITVECYAPNAASRILDAEGRIERIVNNYSMMSFNFGPTLLAWMQDHAREVYELVLEADALSQARFSGHGSAIAQAYNHMIMPLADDRDRYTQAYWGVRDFQFRFRRDPEGMWLPETAVDVPTLEVLARLGIRFTILAPHQARRVRPLGASDWQDVSYGRVDPTMPYLARLPSGRTITLFFYDGPISQAVAFEGLLRNGEHFADRLKGAFSERRSGAQLVHVATDGETYGHHHRHGDMALAYALHRLDQDPRVRLTNYGEFLERHPPAYEVEIAEYTSWSCAHGVERWRSDCGCHTGARGDWHQRWRAPLREALDWLRDTIRPWFVAAGGQLLRDPWDARNAYIDVILDRSDASLDRFFAVHAVRPLSDVERTQALRLLEMQRHLMLMYTSCGWFFDEVSGIETVQVLQYAGRAIQLARDAARAARRDGVPGLPAGVGGLDPERLEAAFLDRLARTESNVPEYENGAKVYEKFVKPAMVDLRGVAAHYAISSVFEPYGERTRIYCYRFRREDHHFSEVGKAKLAVGRARVVSQTVRREATFCYAVLHFGDHNLTGGVQPFTDMEAYEHARREITEAFAGGDMAAAIRLIDRHFGPATYSVKSLFKDEQRKIMALVLDDTLEEAEALYRQIYDRYLPLMRFFRELRMPQPKAFRTAAEYLLNVDLRRESSRPEPDLARIAALLAEVERWNAELDGPGLGYAFGKTVEGLMEKFQDDPADIERLRGLYRLVQFVRGLPFEVNLWKVQNAYYDILRAEYPVIRRRAEDGDEAALGWIDLFRSLGEQLGVRVD